jgi:hypothetical protein
MGWLGFETSSRYVFVVSDDSETRTRWRAVWAKLEADPRAILGAGASFALLSPTFPRGFGMGIAEPGTPSREWLRALDAWTGHDRLGHAPRRLRAEIRLQATGRVLWSASAPFSARDDLMSDAARHVADSLPRRPKDRIETYPTQLVCWLLSTGHGELKRQSNRRIARLLLGAPRDASREIVITTSNTIRDQIRAAKKLIAGASVKT